MDFGIKTARLLTDNETIKNIVTEKLKQEGRLKTYNIVIDCDHALYVEYGTGPASAKDPMYDQFGKSVKERIARWVDEKIGDKLTPRQRKEMAYSVYKNIMENGIPPSPYIRPAIADVMGNPEVLQEIFNSGGDVMFKLSQYIIEVMRQYIWTNGTVYHHELEDHMYIEEGPDIQLTNENDGFEEVG